MRQSVSPPSGPVTSIRALLALARAVEKRAADRYRALAAGMRLRGDERLAQLFDMFAGIEDSHVRRIDDRSRGLAGQRVADVGLQAAPEDFDDEDGSRLLTPYRALAVAVRNEERAFAFYSHVAAAAPDPTVRGLAEDLARDELGHAALLRRERRKAYRAERPDGRPLRPPDPPASLAELQAIVAATEHRAAACHRAVAAALPPQDDALARLFLEIAGEEEECADTAGDPLPQTGPGPAAGVAEGLRLVEEAFERYAEIAGTTRDEAVMAAAQALAARAVGRLAALGRATTAGPSRAGNH